MRTWLSVGVSIVVLVGLLIMTAPRTEAQFACDHTVVFVGVPDGVTLTLYNPITQAQTVAVAVYGSAGYVGGFLRTVAPSESYTTPLYLAAGIYSVETIWPINGFAGLSKGTVPYPGTKATVCR